MVKFVSPASPGTCLDAQSASLGTFLTKTFGWNSSAATTSVGRCENLNKVFLIVIVAAGDEVVTLSPDSVLSSHSPPATTLHYWTKQRLALYPTVVEQAVELRYSRSLTSSYSVRTLLHRLWTPLSLPELVAEPVATQCTVYGLLHCCRHTHPCVMLAQRRTIIFYCVKCVVSVVMGL
ncbi:hypothetical protein Pmani_004261 [Petrolisthes manimaculis]|uniref:Uncharacterized protein n=1 Tax=Petrolisthes manimaculis TaxID=1843537 RepID=A0AAE1QEY6_9EUCA|nr:hypothetical protein Pmani_004261 [Petrolisthes manimaculis]